MAFVDLLHEIDDHRHENENWDMLMIECGYRL